MKEIKFRLRVRRDGKILTFYKTLDELLNCWFNTIQYNSSLVIISKDQYTGVKDIKGKEIYGGDILRDSDNNFINVVEYHNGSFHAGEWCGEDFNYLEIIGNIYENQELLE